MEASTRVVSREVEASEMDIHHTAGTFTCCSVKGEGHPDIKVKGIV